MPNSNKFNPALKYAIKWTVGENTYEDADKYPKKLGLCIPVDSIPDFINLLMALEADKSKHKEGKVYDFEIGKEKDADVVWINAKGMAGDYGDYGNINPQKIESSSDAIPF
tara:strand:+ start:691 stop:1023 length:333 start_codon:yes stop_codon:yes gene_type:complete